MRLSTLAGYTLLFAGGGTPAVLAAEHVDLQLVLAVDISRSMDYNEQRVQREGYAAAFRSSEIHKAIASGPSGRIAVTYMEWSSAFYQRIVGAVSESRNR